MIIEYINSKGKKIRWVLRQKIIGKLRDLSRKSPIATQVRAKYRIEKGIYKCATCLGSFRNKDVVLDHIDPVVSPKDGFVDWNEYIARLFVGVDGFQIMCLQCHYIKTGKENKQRRKNKK